ncbi:restriction endonuclease, partial [Escherichia coli]|nr:restriction endonuclease [Escherichia coli]
IENHHEENYDGIVCNAKIIHDDKPTEVIAVYYACKGDCDKYFDDYYWSKYKAITEWQDISDLAIPLFYLKWIVGIFNDLESGRKAYTKEAFDKTKEITLALSQIVMREMTEKERERVMDLNSLPDYI